jgi:peptidoglycan hydrolase CwlO-like protein
MVKFVCYSQPATSASDLFSQVQAVESVQRSDQSNISKLEAHTKRIETGKSDVDKSIKKLKEMSSN